MSTHTEPGVETTDGQGETLLLRYADLSRHPLIRQLDVPTAALDELIAAALHLTAPDLAKYRHSLTDIRTAAVARLLADPDFTHAVNRLPFTPGDRIGVLGDSISADALSWANLLRDTLIATRRGVDVINESATGRTTADALAALPALLAENPTAVMILLGANDARRYGAAPGVQMASAEETRRNLIELQLMARSAGVPAILITPPPAAPPATAGPLWTATDLDAIAELVRDSDPHAVDLRRATLPMPAFWLPDGVHPSLVGQIQILRDIATALANRDTSDTP